MHKGTLILIASLLIGTSQINAAQDDRDLNSERPVSILANHLQESHRNHLQKVQPVSDEKLIKRQLQSVRSFVQSFLRVPNGVLSWEVGECYADHLIELIALQDMVKEGPGLNVTEKLAQLEKDRDNKLLSVVLVRHPKPTNAHLMNGDNSVSLKEAPQASQNMDFVAHLRPQPASIHTNVAITVQ